MNIYLEIFGYIGTALIILSMTMKSLVRLRILNISGSFISAIYAIISSAWPVVVLNVCLIAVNSYHLIRGFLAKTRGNEETEDQTRKEAV